MLSIRKLPLITSHVFHEANKFTNSHMQQPRLEDYAIIREAMFKGMATILTIQLRDMLADSEEYEKLQQLALQLNPGTEAYTDYREKFLVFVKSLGFENPEGFLEDSLDNIQLAGKDIKGLLHTFTKETDKE